MIKQLALSISILLFSAVGSAQQCTLSGATKIAANTQFVGGPNVVNAVIAVPEIGTAILAARDAWDSTDAVNRIGDWTGTTSSSDCPAGLPFQIGALAFAGSTCPTLIAYGLNNATSSTLAFVDYFPGVCPQCGTKSITVNLNFAWSVTPIPGQYDLQGVLTHEFGHVLGLAHMEGNGTVCNTFPPNTRSATCVEFEGRETMGRNSWPAFTNLWGTLTTNEEICQRSLTQWDTNSVNAFYP